MSDKNTVLVVEDNDFVRMQIVGYLKDAGYGVIESVDGTDALEHVKAKEAVDLAIVDIRMEPMGGLDFVINLRSDDILTPVIWVTGDQTSDLLEQANKWHVGTVLMKPVEKDRLLKTVERTVAATRKRQEF